MNKWQMSGATLTWPHMGMIAHDNRGGTHFSIHPHGRSDAHRDKQRHRRARRSI